MDRIAAAPDQTSVGRHLVDHFCPRCGMFLTATDAPPGKRIRALCASKTCKRRYYDVVVGDPKFTGQPTR